MNKKLFVMAIVTMMIFATPVLASDEDVDVLLYYDADLDADVYYNAETGNKYYYDEGLGDYVTIIDDDEDDEEDDDFAYVHDTLGVEVYYDEDTEEFYYYDDGDKIILITDEDDVDDCDNDWYNSDYPGLYQDEYQASAYGLAVVKTTCNLRNGQGTLLATIYAGEQVILLESIGASGERTWVNYDGIEGSILTSAIVTSYENLTYDEQTQGEGRCGSVMHSAIVGEDDAICYTDKETDDGDCDYEKIYGEAIVKTRIGANMRDEKNKIVCTIPYGEKVLLLEEMVDGGRTRVQYGEYVGTVLTACLTTDASGSHHSSDCTCSKCNCKCSK